MSTWNTFYYQEFPAELQEYSKSRRPSDHCAHCQAPRLRRCLIDGSLHREKSPRFRFAWYGITLFDQGLYRYFRDASEKWVAATGGYPLPVEPSGFGCFRVAAPSRLLAETDSVDEWNEFVAFWLDETQQGFERMTGVSPRTFFHTVMNDKALDHRAYGNPLEPLLLDKALARFR